MIPIHIDCKSNEQHCKAAVILKLQYANHPKADFNCYSSTIISPFIKSSSSSSLFFLLPLLLLLLFLLPGPADILLTLPTSGAARCPRIKRPVPC